MRREARFIQLAGICILITASLISCSRNTATPARIATWQQLQARYGVATASNAITRALGDHFFDTWHADGIVVPFGLSRDRVLVIYFNLDPAPDRPVVQLRLAWTPSGQNLPADGSDDIIVNLDEQQSALIAREGIPAELLAAIDSAAASVGWRPRHTQWPTNPQQVFIDASKYLHK